MFNVAGATPVRWFKMTGAPLGLFTEAENVIRPPPALRICTVAVAIVRLHASTERTTFVVLTSNIGRLPSCPTGMIDNPDDEFANRVAPSGVLMSLLVIGSGIRKPSSGVRLEDLRICNTLCVDVVVGRTMPHGMTPAAVLCGFVLVFSGLIGVCAQKVA